MAQTNPAPTTARFRDTLRTWLDEHADELAPPFTGLGTLDEQIAQMQRVKAVLFAAGWMRYGWPERVGGLGGSAMLRTELGATLAARGLADPGLFSLVEVLAPTLIDFAPRPSPPRWCRSSSPGRRCGVRDSPSPTPGATWHPCGAPPFPTATRPSASQWVINGQKVWTSLAQYSDHCVLLTRTGAPESRHRGITAFFVDMDAPGVTVAPIEMLNGVHEFAEVFFDDVVVPADRILGAVDGGWEVAMSILPYERSSCFWQRVAFLYRRLEEAVEVATVDDRNAQTVGDAFLALHGVRTRSRATQHRLASGETLGAETSVDKVLVATAEQATYDAIRRLLPGTVELDDGDEGIAWRTEYLYSRAATIYGGTAEVQRNIIARRLLDLGAGE